MNFRNSFIGTLILGMTTAAVAQNSSYLNLNVDDAGNGSIGVSETKCTECVNSLEVTNGNVATTLNNLLKSWTPATPVKLSLVTELDLNEFESGEVCSTKHTPIVLPKNVTEFNGNGNVIKNMCFSHDAASGQMNSPMGFFGSINGVTISDIKFNNVLISVTGKSTVSASNFRPTGTLAGMAEDAHVKNLSLEGVKVVGVMAGGVFGYALNSTIENVNSSSKIFVSNESSITSGTAVAGVSLGNGAYTFLGGVVGLAVNVGFSKIDIDVSLSATNNDSAILGGLAGNLLFDHAEATSRKIENVKIGSESSRSSISGGANMGGIFGLIKKSENNVAGLLIENSSFAGDISKPSSSKNYYMGGLIGGNFLSDVSLKIRKCVSDANLKSNVVSGKKHYLGGLVGGMESINLGSGEDDMFSLINTKTAGSIEVVEDAGSSVTAGVISVGGLVGFGGFAVSDSAVYGDTSHVDITVALNGSSVIDSIFVGGFVGRAGMHDSFSSKSVRVVNSEYLGSIAVNGNAKSIDVAGGIGNYYTGEKGNFITFENIKVNSPSSLITLAGSSSGDNNRYVVGGLCASCKTVGTVNNIEVKGNFDISHEIAGEKDSMVVGGIIGHLTTTNVSGHNAKFALKNSYHVGDLNVSKDILGMKQIYVGYLLGYARFRTNDVLYVMKSNYHYGNDMVVTMDAIGLFDPGTSKKWNTYNNECDKNSWESCWDIQYNFRNGPSYGIDAEFNNGTFSDKQMKDGVDGLKKELNYAWQLESLANPVWGFEKGKNDDLPYLIALLPVETPVVPGSSSSSSSETILPPPSSSSSSGESIISSPSSSSSSSETVIPPSCSSSESIQDGSSSSVTTQTSSSSSSVTVPPTGSCSSNVIAVDASARSAEWRMVSVKGLEKAGVSLKTEIPVYWWDESTSLGEYWQYKAYEVGNELSASHGAWIYTADSLSVEELAPIPSGLEVKWDVDSVYSGWNLVANPYAWTIDVSSIDGLDPEDIYVYDGNGYDYAKKLGPFEAAWVRASSFKSLNFVAKSPSVSVKKAMAKSNDIDGWSLQAILTDKYGRYDSLNVMGTSSYVVEKSEPPTAMGDHVSLAIMEGTRALAKSFKPETEEMEWTIKLGATTAREAYLQLDGVARVNRFGKHVYVTIDDRTVEMKDGSSLKVALQKGSVTAKVTVTAEALELMKNPLGKLHVARSGSNLDVRFDAGAVLAGKDMKVDLVGISGKVEAAMQATTAAGTNAFEMTVPKRGVYMLRVRVGSQTAAQRINVQ